MIFFNAFFTNHFYKTNCCYDVFFFFTFKLQVLACFLYCIDGYVKQIFYVFIYFTIFNLKDNRLR